MTDILFVNPSSRQQTYQGLSDDYMALEPPLWCALPAAFLRERGGSVAILDAELEALTPEQTAQRIKGSAKVVCIVVQGSTPSTTSTPKMTSVIELCHLLKERDFDLVLSGLHPAALPERTLEETGADVVCRGEPFDTLSDIMIGIPPDGAALRRDGRVELTPEAERINPDELPTPAWDLLSMEKYRCHSWHGWDSRPQSPYGVAYSSFGCTFACTFCNIAALYGGENIMRYRSPERVVDDIEVLTTDFHVRKLKFLDELFAVKPKRVLEICNLIKKRRLDIDAWAYARVDTVNLAMLKAMKGAGINWVAYGIEAGSERVRDGVSKHMPRERVEGAVSAAGEAGLHVIGNYIFGLPSDTEHTMQATLELATRFNTEYANFYCASALPGSELYALALKNGTQLPAAWSGYSQYAEDFLPMPTKSLTPAQVLAFRDRAFHEYFSNPRYLAKIQSTFGPAAVEEIRKMLSVKLKRAILT